MKPIFLSLFSVVLAGGVAFAQDKKEDAATDSVQVGDLKFSFSKPWSKEKPKSSMRAAQLKYDSEGDLADVEALFFKFGPQSVQANLDRWKGQFQGEADSKSEEKTYGSTKVTFFQASGTYMESSGGPFSGTKTARENWVMLAAVIPMDGAVLFVKLVGPAESMAALEKDYVKLVESPFKK